MEIDKLDEYYSNIEKYYKGKGRLSVKEEEMVMRWETAFAILKHNVTMSVAFKKYKQTMERKGLFLSDSQIGRDFTYASKLFTPLHTMSKDFIRMIRTERAMKRIEFHEKRARKYVDLVKVSEDDPGKLQVRDLAAYEKFMRLIQEDEKLIIKINALDTTDPDLPDFSKLQMNNITINISENSNKILDRLIKMGAVDLSSIDDAVEVEPLTIQAKPIEDE